MKLKQRVVLLLALAVIFSFMYIVAILLSWEDPAGATSTPGTSSPRIHASTSATLSSSVPPSLQQLAAANQSIPLEVNNSNNRTLRGGLQVSPQVASKDPWAIWNDWVVPDYFYPKNSFESEEMNHILATMATAPITSFGLGHKGTQLKATAMLGAQRTVFKPKR